jgi:hypothetical protein
VGSSPTDKVIAETTSRKRREADGNTPFRWTRKKIPWEELSLSPCLPLSWQHLIPSSNPEATYSFNREEVGK